MGTLSSRNPPNPNNLQSTKFQITFPRISTTTYFCQKVSLPGISSYPVMHPTPFVDLYKPGDKLIYGDFSMEFIVDEDLWAWELIHDWIRNYSFPTNFTEYTNLKRLSELTLKSARPQYSDGKLTILSALNNPRFSVNFVDMFPVDLSEIPFDTMLDADRPITAVAKFKYQYYNIGRVY